MPKATQTNRPTQYYSTRHCYTDLVEKLRQLAKQRRVSMEQLHNEALQRGLFAIETEALHANYTRNHIT